MPNFSDLGEKIGTNIVYDERTDRYHDLTKNYRMTRLPEGAKFGTMTKAGVAIPPATDKIQENQATQYVPIAIFDSFKRDIYTYISQIATFARDGLIEIQRSVSAQQKDYEILQSSERMLAEEQQETKLEKTRDKKPGMLEKIRDKAVESGPGLLGFLAIGTAIAGLIQALRMTPEEIVDLGNSIDNFVNRVKSIYDTLSEAADLIGKVLLGLGTFLAGAALIRTMANRQAPLRGPRAGPRTQAPSSGGGGRAGAIRQGLAAATGLGAAAAGAIASLGGGTGGAGRPASSAPAPRPAPPAPPAPAPAPRPAPPAPAPETGTTGTRPAPPTTTEARPPGTPVQAESGATPDQSGKPQRTRANIGRITRALAIPFVSTIIEAINARQEIMELGEKRDKEEINDEEYKSGVISIISRALGAAAGGAIGGTLGGLAGTAFAPGVGTVIGGVLGGYAGAELGADAAERFTKSGIGSIIASATYDKFFSERPTGVSENLESELRNRIRTLREESGQRISATDQLVNRTTAAVEEGRITEAQAAQINEVGGQIGTNIRAGDIELAIDQLQASREGTGETLRVGRNRGGNIIVLPPTTVPSRSQPAGRNAQPQANRSQNGQINDLQARISDGSLQDMIRHLEYTAIG